MQTPQVPALPGMTPMGFKDTAPAVTYRGGQAEWTHRGGDTYKATGTDRSGRRFRITGPWSHIRHINLWRGTKWLVRGGRSYRLVTVTN